MAKLSIATGHAMQIYNCPKADNCKFAYILWPVATFIFATEEEKYKEKIKSVQIRINYNYKL